MILEANQLIDEKIAQTIEDAGIQEVMMRSVLTCESEHGVCRLCANDRPRR